MTQNGTMSELSTNHGLNSKQNKLSKKNALFFLSGAHSFTFNLRFLYEPKHKTCLSKTVWGIFYFRFCFIFIKVLHLYFICICIKTSKNCYNLGPTCTKKGLVYEWATCKTKNKFLCRSN